MSILDLPKAVWKTARYNRDWLRYMRTAFVRPPADELLTFRLRNGRS